MKEKIIAFIVCLLALSPNDYFSVPALANTQSWFYIVCIAGFFCFLFWFSKGHILVKILLVFLLFPNCFLSKAPYLSFSAYILIMIAAGFYLLCLSIKNYDFILKAIQSLFLFNVVLIAAQKMGFDNLFNFGFTAGHSTNWGSVGNPMVLGSFVVCLTPFLILNNKHNIWPVALIVLIIRSFGSTIALLSGLFIYLKGKIKILIIIAILFSAFVVRDHLYNNYIGGRFPIWQRTIEVTLKNHPFVGYGIGTYKVIFPTLSQDVAGGSTKKWHYQGTEGEKIAWRQAHNAFLQILFETGMIGFGLFIGLLGWVGYKVRKNRLLFSGFILMLVNMSWSFPTRTLQMVPLLILFLTICEKEVRDVC